ncbi:MAG TPA: M14 family zinc carboxypeptidase [bacterium]
MNWRSGLIIASVLLAAAFPAQALDPFYHTNQEIYDAITAWPQVYPDSVRVDTIGWSHEDSLPIWAVKISDHVNIDEDEPTVLFVGQVHAEEILGVEIVLALMDTILTKRWQYPYRAWLQELEMWLVPTANPEGHQVVMDEWDIAFRKNKHDLNNNGIFNFVPGMGGDIDGVDINRNFPLNWVHGDSFLQPGGEEYYDYFRGFYPFSETEAQALWDFGIQQNFSFSIVWHSSRSGINSEKVFYPWDWDDSRKYPPDFDVIEYTAIQIATRTPKLGGGGTTYNYFPTDSPRGNQHDSFYASLGAFSFLIECGNANLQPPETTARQVIAANLPGSYYLLNRASGYDTLANHAQITGVVKNAAGMPIPAEVTVLQADGPYLAPRICDPVTGRYRRYLMPGSYDLRISLRGYYPLTSSGIYANPSSKTTRNFTLQPKPIYNFNGLLKALAGEPIPGTMFVSGEDVADTIIIGMDGQFLHSLPEGDYELIFDSPGYFVRFDELHLDQNLYVTFELAAPTTLFQDDFESGLGQWISGGTNDRWGTESADSLWSGGMVATESPNAPYLALSENWLEKATPLDLSSRAAASLRFQHWQYFEPGYDHGQVEVSTDGGNIWELLAGPFDRQDVGWGTAYGNLTPYCGQNDVRLRWYFWSDTTLNEQGWRFDNVEVVAADTDTFVQPEPEIPAEFRLVSVFPNPFNAAFRLLLYAPQGGEAALSVWDIAGREIGEPQAERLNAGYNSISWRMPDHQAGGLYLLRLEHVGKIETRKILYLK